MQFTVRDHNYIAGRIPAPKQFHIMRRIAPVLASLKPEMQTDATAAIGPLADVLAQMTDEQADYVLFGLLEYAQRVVPNVGQVKVVIGTTVNHVDINLPDLMLIAWGVLRHNMADFLPALLQVLPSAKPQPSDQ